MKNIISLCYLLMCLNFLNAQSHESVFPDIDGAELLNQLVNNYKPSSVLDYSEARDVLYGDIYNYNDTITCVYTGHQLYVEPGSDPSDYIYQGGGNNGMNTEHTYPQAFGASSGNARSDMHHLFPTRTPVNGARGNSPFAEINDSQTNNWYYLTQIVFSPPNTNIDWYSEQVNTAFEPREDHKGNVARAMFYFYTMYKSQADAADPNFFDLQKETLCNWHLADPVDWKEWHENGLKAEHQSGKKNPFILDCTLAERSYCSGMGIACTPVINAVENPDQFFKLEQNIPNPVDGITTFRYALHENFEVELVIYNLIGEKLAVLVDEMQTEDAYTVEWDTQELKKTLGAGMLLFELNVTNEAHQFRTVRKMVVLK